MQHRGGIRGQEMGLLEPEVEEGTEARVRQMRQKDSRGLMDGTPRGRGRETQTGAYSGWQGHCHCCSHTGNPGGQVGREGKEATS